MAFLVQVFTPGAKETVRSSWPLVEVAYLFCQRDADEGSVKAPLNFRAVESGIWEAWGLEMIYRIVVSQPRLDSDLLAGSRLLG